MQSLIRSKSAGVTGGRGTAGAGPGRDLLYYVHAQRPCLCVHREMTGVLKGVAECQRGTSNTLGSPQCGFGFELLYLRVGYCKGSGFV